MYQKNWGIYCDLLFLKAFIDLRSQLQGLLTLPHRKSAIWGRNIMKCNWHELIRTNRENDTCQISSLLFSTRIYMDNWESTRGLEPNHHLSPQIRSKSPMQLRDFNAPRCSRDLFPVATGRIWPLLRIPRPDGMFFWRKKSRQGIFGAETSLESCSFIKKTYNLLLMDKIRHHQGWW